MHWLTIQISFSFLLASPDQGKDQEEYQKMTHDGKELNRRITQSLLIEVPESHSVVRVWSGGSPQGASSRQASRYSRTPFDRSQGNHLAMTRMQEIYLVNLEGPNPYRHDLNAWYMDDAKNLGTTSRLEWSFFWSKMGGRFLVAPNPKLSSPRKFSGFFDL